MNRIIVIGAGSCSGFTKLLYEGIDMYGRINTYDPYLDERDAKIAKLRTRLSLAQRSRNKVEVTRLTRELKFWGGA